MPEKAQPEIRVATPDDTDLVAEVARRTFHDAFRDNVAPDDMAAYLRDTFTLDKVAAELTDPDSLFLLATLDGVTVGYAKLHFGPAHPSVTGPSPVKLWRMYADSQWYGRGIGAALMRAAMTHAYGRGGRTLWLTTNIHNHRAIDFYRRWNFDVVGHATFTLGTEIHEDYVMACALKPSA